MFWKLRCDLFFPHELARMYTRACAHLRAHICTHVHIHLVKKKKQAEQVEIGVLLQSLLEWTPSSVKVSLQYFRITTPVSA